MSMSIYSEYKLVQLSRGTFCKLYQKPYNFLFSKLFYFSRIFPQEIIIQLTITMTTAILAMIPKT